MDSLFTTLVRKNECLSDYFRSKFDSDIRLADMRGRFSQSGKITYCIFNVGIVGIPYFQDQLSNTESRKYKEFI